MFRADCAILLVVALKYFDLILGNRADLDEFQLKLQELKN